jgi:glycosyltransferase involved in cell wall biosynthesis
VILPVVALIAPVLGTGWPSGQVLDLACGLLRAGVRVFVLAEEGRLVHEFRRRGIPVELGPLPRRPLLDRRALRAARRAIERHAAGEPVVVHGHGADAAIPAALLASHARAELVLTFYDRADARAAPAIDHALAAAFVHSLPGQEELVNHRGVPRAIIHLVPLGIDLRRIGLEPEPEDADAPAAAISEEVPLLYDAIRPPATPVERVPVIGALGRLEPLGGHEVLLRAVHELRAQGRDFRLLVAGEGPEHRKLLALANELKLQEVAIFSGDLPGREEFFQAIDVFVAPALRDGFGHDLLEAMARGLPVVASGAGAVFEQVEDGVTGLLAAPQDKSALAQALARLLGDRDAARKMGDKARAAVVDGFPVKDLVDGVIEAYERVATARADRERR